MAQYAAFPTKALNERESGGVRSPRFASAPCERVIRRNDPRIKRIHSLRLREERDRTGLFFMEGIRFIFQAMRYQIPIQKVVYSPELLTHPAGQRLARQLKRSGTPCLEVTADIFHSISLADEPQGIGAIVRQQWEPLHQVRLSEGLCWVAHETVQSPGNLGTILRTCDAVGAAGVLFFGSATDPYDPAAVRASMGSLFSQRLVRTNMAEFVAWKRKNPCLLVGTSPTASTDYRQIPYQPPIVLFMGWERQGLSPQHQRLCDLMVRIPMVGQADSLNLAVATGVMLYEIYNQSTTARGAAPAT